MVNNSQHQCPAPGCTRQIANHLLMCRTHWSLVPAPIQRELYAAYKNGRGVGTAEHRAAMEKAIESVTPRKQQQEGDIS